MAESQQLIRVDGQELKNKLCNKQDIIHMLAIEGQYHLPCADDITMSWLREVLAGRKQLIKNKDLCPVNVPRIPEFSCDRLYQQAINDEQAKAYLPDPSADGKRNISRKFLFNGTVARSKFTLVASDRHHQP